MQDQSTLPPLPKQPDGVEIRRVESYPSYAVTTHGKVFRHRKTKRDWKCLLGKRQEGYRIALLTNGIVANNRTIFVHRLVLEVFVGPCPEGMECRHLDGDRENNCIDNLAWGTRTENVHDMMRHDRHNKGSRHGMAKLTESVVVEIKKMLVQGHTQKDIARKFNTSSVPSIARGSTWKHVEVENWDRRRICKNGVFSTSKLTAEEVLLMRLDLESGMTGVAVAKKYGVGCACVSHVKSRKSWRHL